MNSLRRRHYLGFSMIEILAAVAIITVLSFIGMTSFASASKTARDNKRRTDMESVRQALVLYRTEGNSYTLGSGPNGYTTVAGNLVSGGYLSDPYPTDPKGGTYAYTYTSTVNTSFCLCAHLEKAGTGNSGDAICSPLSVGTEDYYCLENP